MVDFSNGRAGKYFGETLHFLVTHGNVEKGRKHMSASAYLLNYQRLQTDKKGEEKLN